MASGITKLVVGHPFDTVKIRMQTTSKSDGRFNGPLDCFLKTVRNEGIRGVYKGATPPLVGLLPTMLFRSWFFVFWSSYEVFSRELKKKNLSDGTVSFIAGGLSATAFWIGAFPSDVVKNRYMTQPDVHPKKFPTPSAVARYLYRTEGLAGFYRGFLPSFLRAFPTNASAVFILLFAVPKKGRLYEQCMQLLTGSDIHFNRRSRQDIALSTNLPIALIFLPAADIPKYVAEGNVDLGISGQDMIVENEVEDKVTEIMELGFGKCRLCVQVPVKGPFTNIEELAGKRIVTSFDAFARKVFEPIDEAKGTKTIINYVSGSVEAACALGLADGIIDLVESGETMRAAGLHDIHTLLDTQSVLMSNKNSQYQDLIDKITSRIRGVITANKYVLCTYNVERDNLARAVQITPGRQGPTVSSLDSHEGWVAVSAMIEKKSKGEVMDRLSEVGATDILVMAFTNCRV
ncbi:uncharacterized protein B0P05DRAFT_470143 [Gilbertella persicaria]|uniref:uncharacterized protein n=1 Tax=Gilbertella persicaria TaxID=101096 RepID=UPI00221F6AAD|nr:uncharacterized protein B0P05DRAFT_470143 [Gilbertella persicaria]KAI8078999.1 hypothetical protein B0P05DRAFT_470143 [Gilbertella persicaria]